MANWLDLTLLYHPALIYIFNLFNTCICLLITDSLSNGVVAVIAAVSSCIVSVVITAVITFVITTHYHKRKYSNKQTAVTQPIVSRTGVIEYEEIKKTSPDNMAMTTNPSYDVAMTSNPAYGHNVKKIDQGSDYYN